MGHARIVFIVKKAADDAREYIDGSDEPDLDEASQVADMIAEEFFQDEETGQTQHNDWELYKKVFLACARNRMVDDDGFDDE